MGYKIATPIDRVKCQRCGDFNSKWMLIDKGVFHMRTHLVCNICKEKITNPYNTKSFEDVIDLGEARVKTQFFVLKKPEEEVLREEVVAEA